MQNTHVFNLSATILSQSQISLLSKGLHFSPTTNFDLFRTIMDVNRFARTLTLRKHFFKGTDKSPCPTIAAAPSPDSHAPPDPAVFLEFNEQQTLCIPQPLQQDPHYLIQQPQDTKIRELRVLSFSVLSSSPKLVPGINLK